MFALGFIAAGALIAKRLPELGKPADWAYEMAFAALVGGVIGSRIYFIVENYDQVKDDLVGNLFSGSGLVWYGGAIGGAIAVLLWARYRGFLGLVLLDVCAPALAIGYAIGRIGCQLSGDGDYGKAWDGPWAMAYPDGTVPTDHTVHPTPVYETVAMCLLRLSPLAAAGPLPRRDPLRDLPDLRGNRALPGRVHPPQRSRLRSASPRRSCESLAMIVAGSIWVLVVRSRHGDPGQDPRRPQPRTEPATS